MTTGIIMLTLICVISMEFLPLSRRRSSSRNVSRGEERGETVVFVGSSRVNFQLTKNNSLLTLKMTSAQVVETSVVADGSSIQDTHIDDHFPRLESPLPTPFPVPC